jgi:hypothetical protein
MAVQTDFAAAETSATPISGAQLNASLVQKDSATNELILGDGTVVSSLGMLGNIADPLVQIPFRRADDETRLSGVQTFTRASTGTYVDPLDGLVKTAAVDAPRFERMSDGGIGIPLEGASTNVELNSDAFATNHTNDGSVTITAGQTDPRGGVTADLVTATASTSQHVLYGTSLAEVGAATYTLSFFVKMGTNRYVDAWHYNATDASDGARFDLSLGTVVTTSGNATGKIRSIGNGWYRCEVTSARTVDSTARIALSDGVAAIGGSWAALGTESITLWGVQSEALPFASSYIPTTTATVTRAGDVLSLPVSGNVPAHTPYTFVMDIEFLGKAAAYEYLLYISGTTPATILYRNPTTDVLRYQHNSLATGSIAMGTATHRVAVGWDAANVFVYVDGALDASTASADNTGTPATFEIGRATSTIYAHIRNFRIYDRALTAAEIAAA